MNRFDSTESVHLGSETMTPRIPDALEREDVEREAPQAAPRVGTKVLTTAELAPCTCPEFCERDHDLD